MVNRIAIFVYALFLDTAVILSARKIILDFLRGSCSKKSFRQLIEKQSLTRKLTLSYIGDYIKNPEYRKPFSFYKYCYYTFLCLCPIKDIALLMSGNNPFDTSIMVIANYTFCIIFGIIFSVEAPGKRHSRYAGRKYNKM